MEDIDAIRRLQQGDIGGLEILVRRYQREALKTAYLICHDVSQAEDIVQSAFLRAFDRIAQFDTSRQFAPWFMRSVANEALALVSRQRTVSLESLPTRPIALDRAYSPSPDEAVLAAETQEQVWAALERLAPFQRAAIVERYFLDVTDAEMAARTSTPEGTVRRRLHDARRRLRQLLPT